MIERKFSMMKWFVLTLVASFSLAQADAPLTAGQAARIQKATASATSAVLSALYASDRFGSRIVSPELIRDTQCVVAMQITRGAFLLGGEGGEGAMTCRLARGWSAPSYVRTGGFELSAAIGFDVMNVTLFITNPALAEQFKGQLNFDTRAYASAVAASASAALTAAGRFGMAVVQTSQTGLFAGVGISFTSMSHMQAQRNQLLYNEIFGGSVPVDRMGRPCASYILPARRDACVAAYVASTGGKVVLVSAAEILSLPSYKAPAITRSFVAAVESNM
jgi:SH3 domain-containing YSC84-like protein 1